jgi:hypothetical protein
LMIVLRNGAAVVLRGRRSRRALTSWRKNDPAGYF